MAKSKAEWLRSVYPKSADRLRKYTTVSDMDVVPVYTPEYQRNWLHDD